MAYADTIRTNTCNMNDVAGLIEGIFASTYGLAWTAWTPTYGAGGSMTFTGVTTTLANYIQCGKFVVIALAINGTTGGSASNYLTLTLPIAPSSNLYLGAIPVIDNGAMANGFGYSAVSGSKLYLYRDDSANFTLGAGEGAQGLLIYPAA
jgi:hypothetical protein